MIRVSTLTLKAWRDTLAHRGQFAALILLVGLGISSYVTFQNGYYDLRASLNEAYSRLHFAEITARVEQMPLSAARDIAALPGVAAARVRTVQDVGLEFNGDEQATARIISVPLGGGTEVNTVHVESGTFPPGIGRASVVVDAKFATETGVAPGDLLTLRIRGTRQQVRVLGIGTDPEYLYAVRSEGEIPSPGEFAVFWITENERERLLGGGESGNDMAIRARPGTDLDALADQVEDELKPYGVFSVNPPSEQPGWEGLRGELEQNRIMSRTMPTLVLAISAMSLFIALSRLVQSQRGEIGLAKALGYTDRQILFHYLTYALIIAAFGSLLGVGLGLLGARGIATSYTAILGLPFLTSGFYPQVVGVAVGLAVVACVLAALVPALSSARLAPAVAMHADPNKSLAGGRIPLIERLFSPLLPRSFTFRVPLRNVFRARRRSLYTVLGIAFAMVLMVVTISMFDSIDWLLDKAFTQVERWDIVGVFEGQVSGDALAKVRRMEGVSRVQPALILPVKIAANGQEEDVSLTALDANADFHGFTQVQGAPALDSLGAGDIVLAQSTAKRLGVVPGSLVWVDSPFTEDPVRMRVGSLSEEILGQPGFISLEAVTVLTKQSINTYNALYLSSDPARAEYIRDELYQLRGVASVQVKAGLVDRLKAMLELMNVFGAVLLVFGAGLAFVVVFTTFTANVTERTREIATMRTIGEDSARLAIMVTLENLLLAVAALPLGIWLGVKATDAVFASFETEAYTLKAFIYPESIAQICALMLAVMLLSEIPPVRRIFRLDLAEATKVME